MSYENLKLVSVRLDPEIIEKLDELATNHFYWKRSDVIRNILYAVLAEFDSRAIYNMIQYRYNRQNVVNTKFEITGELKPYERK